MRRSKTTAFEFQPFSRKQKQVLKWWMPEESPYHDYEYLICDGSIRAGKTVVMILSFILWSKHTFKGRDFIIAGRSAGALKRNVIKPMFQILSALGMELNRDYFYHRTENYIQIGTNFYHLFGANNEASQDAIQGMTAAGAYADEAALFPKSFIDQMAGRCSVDGAKIWMNCNPKGPRHYIKTEYIDQAKQKRLLRLHFTLDDNPSLSPQRKEFYKRSFTGVFYKRNILGLWVMAEGVIYDMWDEEKHTFSELPEGDYSYQIWCDYGTTNPCVFLLVAKKEIDGEPYYWVLKEYYYDSRMVGRQKTDKEYYSDLVDFIGGRIIEKVIIDPSAASFIAEIHSHDSLPVFEADNSVEDGIREMATAIHTGRFKVHKDCDNMLREFESYVWDEKASQRGEDKPLKANDHTMDAGRYGIKTQAPVQIFI